MNLGSCIFLTQELHSFHIHIYSREIVVIQADISLKLSPAVLTNTKDIMKCYNYLNSSTRIKMFLMFISDSLSYHYDAFASNMIRGRFSGSEQRTTTVWSICIIYFHVQARLGDATGFSNVPQTTETSEQNEEEHFCVCCFLPVIINQHSSNIVLFEYFTSHLFGETELTFPDIHFSPITFRNITLRFLLIHFKATYEEFVECKHVTELCLYFRFNDGKNGKDTNAAQKDVTHWELMECCNQYFVLNQKYNISVCLIVGPELQI